jgi:NAD(P)-dependent dehydrogenase (short-subunit alcohol dehydrogenase family)
VQIDLSSKVVLVTGGSRGIGAEVTKSVHEAGASVCFTHLSGHAESAALVEHLGDRALSLKCDVADPIAARDVVDACVGHFGGLDVLVNNAAIFAWNPFDGPDYEAWRAGWRRTFEVNLFGAANFAYLAIPQMRRRGGGTIINVASRAAHRGELTFADYGASKAALVNLTKSIARALAKEKITAFAVAPGFIETQMAAEELAKRKKEIEAEIPSGRVGTPAEVASIITFLASGLASYATGSTIDVNGASYVR